MGNASAAGQSAKTGLRGCLTLSLLFAAAPALAQEADSTPAGMVAFFMTSGTYCPAGWSAPSTAQGRVLVGVSNGQSVGTTVGVAMADQTAPTHGHTFASLVTVQQKYIAALDWFGSDQAAGHDTYDVPQSPPGQTNNGTPDSADLPFIQLVVCQKN